MISNLINRKKADNDRRFNVSISGVSRGRWALLMHVLRDWMSANQNACNPAYITATKEILQAIESHVVEDNDGYSFYVPYGEVPSPVSELEAEALSQARLIRAKELKEMRAFEKRLGLVQGKRQRRAKASSQKVVE